MELELASEVEVRAGVCVNSTTPIGLPVPVALSLSAQSATGVPVALSSASSGCHAVSLPVPVALAVDTVDTLQCVTVPLTASASGRRLPT